jgi:anti-sigma regulatory factor (Ser/Thr protein kinase)
MLDAGAISQQGGGRSVRYFPPIRTFHRRLPRQGLEEGDVWDEIRRSVPEVSEPRAAKARAVLAYAFTEMLNNAIDHSGSREVEVSFDIREQTAKFTVADEGIGVYENVRTKFKLASVIAALQEISKGKVTTQSDRHTGEGLFFTSKAADFFQLEANGLEWSVDNRRNDTAIANAPERRGTRVQFELSLLTTKSMDAIFAQYSEQAFQFDTSRIIVKLFEHGVDFVSRSEAKRIVTGLERFRHVIVDFRGIKSIGQGFADEIFRVWSEAHPDVRLEAINMEDPVKLMVERSTRPSANRSALLVGEPIRKMDFPLGWTEEAIARVLDDSESFTNVTVPSDPDGNIVVASRRNRRSSDWSYLGIVVARGRSSRAVVSAFILLRDHAPEDVWKDPLAALKRFVDIYGRPFTVGQSQPKKFFLDEAYPVANADPTSPVFLIPAHAGRGFSAIVRARRSELGVASVTIGYVVNYDEYSRDLSRAGIQIAFS